MLNILCDKMDLLDVLSLGENQLKMNPELDICVCNPVTKDYTTFEIVIQTTNPAFTMKKSHTRRRYSDFCWLKKLLKVHHPLCICPELPEKKQSTERFEAQFLVQRMRGLEEWLQSIVSVDLFLSDTSLHLFLQSSLTCPMIEQYLKGQLSENIVRMAYRDCEFQTDSIELIQDVQSITNDDDGGAGRYIFNSSDVDLEQSASDTAASDPGWSSESQTTSYRTSLESDMSIQ